MPVAKLKNYLNGNWVLPITEKFMAVTNPSTGEIINQVPVTPASEVADAISKAYEAFLKWRIVPISKRTQPLFKLENLLRINEEKIAKTLVEEMGKSLPDARAEIKRTIENCQVACSMPILQQGDKLIGSAHGIDGEVIRLPLGVFAMIAPFNFPAMVPFWFLPYAIATGNSFVLKASELVPNTMQLITEYIDQIGLPPGVFTLINGNKDVGEAIVNHPKIVGLSIVGKSSTCQIVAEKCARSNKRFQGMGSAKNHLVVMPDAKIDKVIQNMTTSCYGCAGQRCMASSAIVVVGDEMYDVVCEKFIESSKEVIVADPLNPKVKDQSMVMGPVISADAKKFILGMIETGVNEGATLALDGRGISVPGCEGGYFVGPTVFTNVKPGMKIHNTEIFGPVVVILKAASLDEAIEIINNHPYGNGASIYTQNGYWARKFKLEVNCGMIGVNVGIPAPVAYLPFGGMKKSIYADIKAQGKAIVDFYTDSKVITERYWSE